MVNSKKPHFNKLVQQREISDQELLNYFEYLGQWLKYCLQQSGRNGFVFGLSGGIDSALIACLLKTTLTNKNYFAVTMHIDNSLLDHELTQLLIESYNLPAITLELSEVFSKQVETIKSFLPQNQSDVRLIVGNVKTRLRMLNLYSLGQCFDYLVIGATNCDEWMTGYFTKFGDSACDLMPLKYLIKSDIYRLARLLKLPQKIIDRTPTASLYENQSDEDELGISYDTIDRALTNQCQIPNRLIELHQISCHKRRLPLAPLPFRKISNLKFSADS